MRTPNISSSQMTWLGTITSIAVLVIPQLPEGTPGWIPTTLSIIVAVGAQLGAKSHPGVGANKSKDGSL